MLEIKVSMLEGTDGGHLTLKHTLGSTTARQKPSQ
jgi:hypothetical protein